MTAAFLAMSLSVQAQWVRYPTPGLPRTADGAADLGAPAPRASDGKPDLSGVWQAEATPIPELMALLPGGQNGLGESVPTKYFIDIFADFKRGEAPLQPVALATSATLAIDRPRQGDVGLYCLPGGLPLFVTVPAPFKIVQTPGLTVMLSEGDNSFRQIFTDGRPLPEDPQPQWIGSSIGRWEGDTFVVETVGFNDRGQLDALGHRHSTALRVMERYTRRDVGHMAVELTLTDPEMLTRPVTVKFNEVLRPDTDLIEYVCTENEKDRQRIHAPATPPS
jgi:hypothetical protein